MVMSPAHYFPEYTLSPKTSCTPTVPRWNLPVHGKDDCFWIDSKAPIAKIGNPRW
jgi:hypothetical protein